MGGIFISHRRQESAGHAGRIRDRLRQRFGDRVFQDVDSIADGELFESVIERALATCEVALVVIGRHWLDSTDAAGRRCLDKPEDWVLPDCFRQRQRSTPGGRGPARAGSRDLCL